MSDSSFLEFFPWPAYISFQILFSVSLALPKHLGRSTYFMILCGLYVYLVRHTTHSPLCDFSLGLQMTVQLGRAIDFLLLTDPDQAFFKIDHGGGTSTHSDSPTLSQRVLRSFDLMHSPRGIGWNWEVPHVSYAGCHSKRYAVLPSTRNPAD